MNILPKKRWHVRTKDNIARVRKDEAQAAEEEKAREQRAKLAEKEARTAYLRARARQNDSEEEQFAEPQCHIGPQEFSATLPQEGDPATSKMADIYTEKGNINLFKELEAGLATSNQTNADHEAEKKEEIEKYEKSIGLLTYLGQGGAEKHWFQGDDGRVVGRKSGKLPADNKVGQRHVMSMDNVVSNSGINVGFPSVEKDIGHMQVEEVGLKSKLKMDPLSIIKKYTKDWRMTSTKPSIVSIPGELTIPQVVKLIPNETELKRAITQGSYTKGVHEREKNVKRKQKEIKEKKKKEKKYGKKESSKHKHKKHRRHDDDSSDSSSDRESASKRLQLEALRAERLSRETKERRRAELLLRGLDPDGKDPPQKGNEGIKQKYHAQFNPHLARQNAEPRTTLQAGVKYWQH